MYVGYVQVDDVNTAVQCTAATCYISCSGYLVHCTLYIVQCTAYKCYTINEANITIFKFQVAMNVLSSYIQLYYHTDNHTICIYRPLPTYFTSDYWIGYTNFKAWFSLSKKHFCTNTP